MTATRMEQRDAAEVLRDLASLHEADFSSWMERILRADADAIDVARVSYWSLQAAGTEILCEALVIRGQPGVARGTRLGSGTFPTYFAAMRSGQVIDATDAHRDPRTCEFSESYLGPLGIGAMLDVPVFVRGLLAGVVCHEHLGPARVWSPEEQQLALAMGQSLALAMEVQARRVAEEAVRVNERRFRAIVEASPIAMLVTRASDGQVLYANEALSRLSGIPLEKAPERNATELYADPAEHAETLALLQRDGRVRQRQVRLARPDGSAYWASLSVEAIDFEGEPALISGIADLSEAKRAEAALRAAHDQTAAANRELREAMAALESRDARLLEDIAAAREFQQSSLPELPEVAGLEIDVAYRPLDQVGGDVYAVELHEGRELRLFLADATGHGVEAALATMFLLSEHDVARRIQAGPAAVLGALNARMTGRFARLALRFTALCLDLDLATGVVRWSCAAHPGPVAVLGERVRELPTGGTFVGVSGDAAFPEWTDTLEPGEAVCLLTDGVTDAFDVTGEGFGDRRAQDALVRALASGRPPATEVLNEIERFVGAGRRPDDDATLLVIRRAPGSAS